MEAADWERLAPPILIPLANPLWHLRGTYVLRRQQGFPTPQGRTAEFAKGIRIGGPGGRTLRARSWHLVEFGYRPWGTGGTNHPASGGQAVDVLVEVEPRHYQELDLCPP